MDLRFFSPAVWSAAAIVSLSLLPESSKAALPYDWARVSIIQNDVAVGALTGGDEHVAKINDTVRSSHYLSTQTDSRAELTFEDNSIVRVGQNAIFTFEAASRTLSLKKGAMMFFVPPGSGGGNIKTPSLTAAIAGTVAKVAVDGNRELIAVLSGELHTKYGVVRAGQAIQWVHGTVQIFRFNPAEVETGKLYLLGGRPLPEEPEVLRTGQLQHLGMPDLHQLDLQDIQVNQNVDHAPKPRSKPTETPPESTPTPTPTPRKPTPTPVPR